MDSPVLKDSTEADVDESARISGIQKQIEADITSTKNNTLACSVSFINDQVGRFSCRLCHRVFATNRGLRCCIKSLLWTIMLQI